MGPIIVRTEAFRAVGMFNTSYSLAGKPGLGFEGPFTSRLWVSGYRAAVSCAAASLLFHNGCGGQGTLMLNRTRGTLERNEAGRRSAVHWASEFPSGLGDVRRRVEQAQRELNANASLAEAIEATLPPSAQGGGCARDCARQGSAHRAVARAAEELCGGLHI